MTTIDTLTDAQIVALRAEAASAGDNLAVAICDRALMGTTADIALVVTMIRDAEAQAE